MASCCVGLSGLHCFAAGGLPPLAKPVGPALPVHEWCNRRARQFGICESAGRLGRLYDYHSFLLVTTGRHATRRAASGCVAHSREDLCGALSRIVTAPVQVPGWARRFVSVCSHACRGLWLARSQACSGLWLLDSAVMPAEASGLFGGTPVEASDLLAARTALASGSCHLQSCLLRPLTYAQSCLLRPLTCKQPGLLWPHGLRGGGVGSHAC